MQVRLIFILTVYCVFSTIVLGQKGKEKENDVYVICGESTYHVPENVTLEQAKQIALERARMSAIEEHFHIVVTVHNVIVMKNENENSHRDFLSVGGSEGKADWLGDTQEPKYNIFYEDNQLVISVSICGYARKIIGAGIDFSAKILRNGTEAKFEDDKFKHRDDCYLMFRSPVDGYLAVYLTDMEKVYCLLPYMGTDGGKRKITGGKDYVFFSEKHADVSEENTVIEYIMTCEKQTAVNFMYIIFSPNEFTKANDYRAENETVLPRELPFNDFQKWLINNLIRDKDMKVEKKSVVITK